MQIRTTDDTLIDYNLVGSGQLMILLHGFGNDQSIWSKAGWVDRLKSKYTVLTFDIRGCGKSEISNNIEFYSIENHFKDIDKLIEVTGQKDPIVWGWSLGATIALLYARRRNVKATVACGTYFGKIFTEKFVDKQLNLYQNEISTARLKAFGDWPVVYPNEIKSPFLVYSGSNDGNVVIQLRVQHDLIINSGGEMVIFDNFDHFGLVNEINIIEPVVVDFLERVIQIQNVC